MIFFIHHSDHPQRVETVWYHLPVSLFIMSHHCDSENVLS